MKRALKTINTEIPNHRNNLFRSRFHGGACRCLYGSHLARVQLIILYYYVYIMLYLCKLCGNDSVYKQRSSGPQFWSVNWKKMSTYYMFISVFLLILAGRLYVSVTQCNIITRKTK